MRICDAPGYNEAAMGALLNVFSYLDAGNGEWLQAEREHTLQVVTGEDAEGDERF